jgi:hypothetical protein
MIEYRPAEKEDSLKLAEMINTASDGVVEYLFHDQVPDMTPVQAVTYNLENDTFPHSYKSALVACERFGFKVVQKVDLRSTEYIIHEDGCLLMRCKIAP